MVLVYLGLGANLGNPKEQLEHAVQSFRDHPHCSDIYLSAFIQSNPYNCPKDSPVFTNAVMSMKTDMFPHALLALCQSLEEKGGRDPNRLPLSNTPRPLDIDILFYGDSIIKEPTLEVPHPRLHERLFVLEPLCELNKSIYHPVQKKTIDQLLALLTT